MVNVAKLSPEEIADRVSIVNRGTQSASLSLLPSLMFRDT